MELPFDGAITLSTYGSLLVTAARTLGSSDANDMVFTTTQAPVRVARSMIR